MALDVQRIPIEIQFAQGLAGNEQKNRDKTLGLLRKFIKLRLPRLKEQLKEDEFIKLWKGMHYQLWMQDKPLIQEKLVKDICQLVHDFPNETYTLMFIKAFFETEAREWYGLDQWRMNKFMMLVREFLHHSFRFLRNYEWKKNVCQNFGDIIEHSVMSCTNIDLPIGLKLHILDIYLDELRKVASQKLSSDTAVILLSPFVNILPTVKNGNVLKKLLTLLFVAGGGEECLTEFVSENSDDESDSGVERKPQRVRKKKLEFNKESLINQLMEKGASKKCSAKNRNRIYRLIKRIRSLETNPQKPIRIVKGEEEIRHNEVEVPEEEIHAAVKQLKKQKKELLEKVPLRKDYKMELIAERKIAKQSGETEINDLDTEEEDDGIDMEGCDDDNDSDDSLEYDPEAAFFQMSTESEDGEEVDEDEENMEDDDIILPNGIIEDESAENEEQESPVPTKKNKKSKTGTKRKIDESVEEVAIKAPEKKAKTEEKVKGKKKKVDDVADDGAPAADGIAAATADDDTPADDSIAAVDDDEEEMEVAVPEEKAKPKKKKQKKKKKAEETADAAGTSLTEVVFGMVDFPEEEEDDAPTDSANEAEVTLETPQESSEEISKPEEAEEETTTSKKVKKAKKTKKNKKTKVTEEPTETDDKTETTETPQPLPLPTDAKEAVDDAENTLQLFEHLKKIKEESKQSEKSKKKKKTSQFDQYLSLLQKEVESLEENTETLAVVEEEKDSTEDKAEEVTVQESVAEELVDEAEVPVTEESSKMGKGKKKKSLKTKKAPKTEAEEATPVEEESEKAEPEPESEDSGELDKLFETPPAFLEKVLAKAAKKLKKGKKSKNKKSVSPKETSLSSVSPGEKRRVIFDLEKNRALAFCKGTKLKSDETAFIPDKQPGNGILKPSPSPIRIKKKFSMEKKLNMLAKPSFMAHFL